MLSRSEWPESTQESTQESALRSELESLRRQLGAARARNVRWRAVIERHLDKGCPSRTLRALLLEADPSSDQQEA